MSLTWQEGRRYCGVPWSVTSGWVRTVAAAVAYMLVVVCGKHKEAGCVRHTLSPGRSHKEAFDWWAHTDGDEQRGNTIKWQLYTVKSNPIQQTFLTCYSKKNKVVKSQISNGWISFGCFSNRVLILCILAHCQTVVTYRETQIVNKTSLLFLVTPVLFQQWKVTE